MASFLVLVCWKKSGFGGKLLRPLAISHLYPMSGKLFIKTFGCQMNEYDTAKMADLLRESHGLELTDQPEQADVLLLDTCSIRE